jgi:hypothetical protein
MNLNTETETESETEKCYSERTDPYIYFSTKTSYFAVDNEDTKEIKFEGKVR